MALAPYGILVPVGAFLAPALMGCAAISASRPAARPSPDSVPVDEAALGIEVPDRIIRRMDRVIR